MAKKEDRDFAAAINCMSNTLRQLEQYLMELENDISTANWTPASRIRLKRMRVQAREALEGLEKLMRRG